MRILDYIVQCNPETARPISEDVDFNIPQLRNGAFGAEGINVKCMHLHTLDRTLRISTDKTDSTLCNTAWTTMPYCLSGISCKTPSAFHPIHFSSLNYASLGRDCNGYQELQMFRACICRSPWPITPLVKCLTLSTAKVDVMGSLLHKEVFSQMTLAVESAYWHMA